MLGTLLGDGVALSERLSTACEKAYAHAVGEEAVVADADEAFGEDVEQEASDELGKRQAQGSRSTAAIVLEAEGGPGVIDVKQPVVRDGDAVSVTREVLQYRHRAVEGRLGIDDPVGAAGFTHQLLEGSGVPVASETPVQLEASVSERGAEACYELAAEEAAEDAYGQEEAGSAGLPGASVVGQATGRHDAVDVGMMDEGLTPGVKDDEEAEASAEVAGVACDLLKGVGGRMEQEVVDDLGTLQRERCEGPRQREDDVGIGHGQHIGLARVEPPGLGAALTLWAMTVPTRVVGDLAVATRVALVDVPAKASGATGQDLIDDLVLLPAPGTRQIAAGLSLEVPPEDLGDLVSRSLGHLLREGKLRAQSIQRTARGTHALRGHMCVGRRGLEGAVAQQRLDHP